MTDSFKYINYIVFIRLHNYIYITSMQNNTEAWAIRSRMQALLSHYALSMTDLALRIKQPYAQVYRMCRQGKPFTPAFLVAVLRAFPAINPVWLLTGLGEMMRSGAMADLGQQQAMATAATTADPEERYLMLLQQKGALSRELALVEAALGRLEEGLFGKGGNKKSKVPAPND